MLPEDFHPILRRWWETRFRGPGGDVLPPTEAQLEGWRAIRSGRAHADRGADRLGQDARRLPDRRIDGLLRESLERAALPDEVRVIYVSPLKALSADIHKNLAEPRREIRRIAEEMGHPPVRITAAVRSGDTPQKERAAMLRTPPHILVTTPESLYLLLTAERSREMLKTARVVIVDEIHAVLESRRGAHLALSLERLDHVCGRRLQRIGLSATQKPIEEVAKFLVGADAAVRNRRSRPQAQNRSRHRSPGLAARGGDVARGLAGDLRAAGRAHRSAPHDADLRQHAAAGRAHGAPALASAWAPSTSRRTTAASPRRRASTPNSGCATASSRCWSPPPRSSSASTSATSIWCARSPRRTASRRCLQRVGRSGHTVRGLPKGRVFPLTRDDLIECAAMVRAVKDGELDRVAVPEKPLDVLAQQIVAESATEEWDEDALFDLFAARVSVPRPRARPNSTTSSPCSRTATRPSAAAARRSCITMPCNRKLRARTALAHDRDHVGRRHPGSVRLPRHARARGPLHRHAQRGLRHRVAARRRFPARQYVVAHPAHRQRRGARRRRARPAAVDAVLARRSAGAQRRGERRGVAAARRGATRYCPRPSSRGVRASSTPRSTGSMRDYGLSRSRGRADRGVPRRGQALRWASCRRRRRSCSSASSTNAAACSSCCTRRSAAASTGLGPRAAQEVLPELQFRTAGGGDRGRPHPVARADAFVPARRRVPLSESRTPCARR